MTAGRLRGRLPADPAPGLLLLFAAWVATRVLLLVGSLTNGYPAQSDTFDMHVFAAWGAAFAGADGVDVPLRDAPWEYPVGAVPVVLAPSLADGVPYALAFVGQVVLWDAALLLVLAVVGLRRGSLAGCWLWVAAVPLLGPVALTRYDVVPTALAVAGLASPPLLAGALLATGAAVKLWPGMLLPVVLALRPGPARTLLGAGLVGVVVLGLAGAGGALPRLLSFLEYQRDRGLEVEALPALPLMLARAGGDERMTIGFGFGSYQVDGPWAPAMLTVASVGFVAVLVAVAVLVLRARGSRDALLPAVVLLLGGVLVFDKVLSAQYPLWLAGLVALALCEPRSPLRPAALPLTGVLLLTHLVYPLTFEDLLDGDLRPVLLLVVRDVLLLAVVAVAGRALWRTGTASARDGGPLEDEVPLHVEDRQQPQTAG